MLATFRDLDYSVEWRMINAADYGFAQRRRRVFIFAYKNGLSFDCEQGQYSKEEIVFKNGFFAKPFAVKDEPYKNRIDSVELPEDIVEISDEFSFTFHPAGVMRNGEIFTAHVDPIQIEPTTLGEILLDETEIDEKFYLSKEEEEKFDYMRGPKKIERQS